MKKQKIKRIQKQYNRLADILANIYEAGSEMCSMGESTKRVDHEWKFFSRREKRLFKKYGMLVFGNEYRFRKGDFGKKGR